MLAWLAQQVNLVNSFARGEDVYKKMAGSIYCKQEGDISAAERFIGKTTILGAGYGMGSVRFKDQLKGMGVEVEADECKRIIDVYRSANGDITNLWRQAQNVLMGMYQGDRYGLGKGGVLSVRPEVNGICLPSGLIMRYEDLKAEEEERGLQFSYKTRRGRVNIYGGKVIENVCQAIARCVIVRPNANAFKGSTVFYLPYMTLRYAVYVTKMWTKQRPTSLNVCDGHPIGRLVCP